MLSLRLLAVITSLTLAVTIVFMNPIKAIALEGVCVDAPGMPCKDVQPPDHPRYNPHTDNEEPPPRTNWDHVHERKAYVEGFRLYKARNYESAIAKYKEAWGYCHTGCDYINEYIDYARRDREWYRGNQFWHQKDWNAAIAAYKKALGYCRSGMKQCEDLRKALSDARYNQQQDRSNRAKSRGLRLLNQRDYDGAIAVFKKAWKSCASNEDCRSLKRNIAIAKRDRETYRGKQLFDKKDYDGAIATFKKAKRYCQTNCDYLDRNIAIAKRNREAYRGQKLFYQMDFDGAISTYKKALRYCRSDMDCDSLRKALSEAQYGQENAHRQHENSMLERKANRFTKAGNLHKAEAILRNLKSLNPTNSHYAEKLAKNLLNQKKYGEAEIEAKIALSLDPLFSTAQKILDDIHRQTVKDWKQVVRQTPEKHRGGQLGKLSGSFDKGNPGSSPGSGKLPAGTTAGGEGGAKGQARAAANSGGHVASSGNAAGAAFQAGRVFDRGDVKVSGKPSVFKAHGMKARAVPESVRQNPRWQALERQGKEYYVEQEKAQRKIDAIKQKLQAGEGDKGKLQVELVHARDAKTKIDSKVNVNKVEKESFIIFIEKKITKKPENRTGNQHDGRKGHDHQM